MEGRLKDLFFSYLHGQLTVLLLVALGGISACNPVMVDSTPIPSRLPTPASTPSLTMGAKPSAEPSPALVPSSTSYASPTPSPTELPSTLPTSWPWVYNPDGIDYVTLSGKIFDDTLKPLDGVFVGVRSLNLPTPFQAETIASNGQYTFNKGLQGITIEITASKPGFTTRKRVEVTTTTFGRPNANRYDFGNDGKATSFSASYNALSDKPEVTRVTPARNGSNLDPSTDFILNFSEPMDRSSVEASFSIRSLKNHKLSVDNTILKFPSEQGFRYTLFGKDTNTRFYEISNGTPIYDSSAFNITWNAEDTQVTFQFKPGLSLPTDKTPELAPHYQVAFKNFTNENRILRDKTGVERKEKHFKLTDGDFEDAYQFQVKEDQQVPSLQAALWAGFSGQMPTLLLQYSEPMLLKTYSLNIAGGMADEPPSCKQAPAGFPGAKACTASKAAENYQVKVTAPSGALSYQGTWANLGGEASYAAWDASYRTIVLSSKSILPAFVTGAQVEITAHAEIVDPAGNALDLAKQIASLFVKEN